jgi:hypothetical protein
MAVHRNIQERLASKELMYNKFGKLVSTKKHKLGKRLYKEYEDVMKANRASPFTRGRSNSVGGRRRSRRSR